jgi:hypothetical protein
VQIRVAFKELGAKGGERRDFRLKGIEFSAKPDHNILDRKTGEGRESVR